MKNNLFITACKVPHECHYNAITLLISIVCYSLDALTLGPFLFSLSADNYQPLSSFTHLLILHFYCFLLRNVLHLLWVHVCGAQRTTGRNQFSPSTGGSWGITGLGSSCLYPLSGLLCPVFQSIDFIFSTFPCLII